MSRLATEFCGMKLSSPIFTASGTFGFGEEFQNYVDFSKLGGIMVKGTTLKPRRGNDGNRLAETSSGMLNSIGLENPGVDVFIEKILPRIENLGTNIVVNISGSSYEDFGKLAEILDKSSISAVEVNISCPNVRDGGIIFGTNPTAAAKVTEAVKNNTSKPVIVKLSPNVTDITEIARAVENAGADSISMINTLLGMAIDIRTRKPVLGNITGGLSGRAVKPVALRMVYQVSKAVKIPIIGMGGIYNWIDAVEFFLAGASAVAVGTANFSEPDVTMKIVDGLENYLQEQNLELQNLIGGLIE